MQPIRLAVFGVGNCAGSLIQGINFYRTISYPDAPGLMHWEIGGYRPGDIEVSAAFDVDVRKVGKSLAEGIFAAPNNTLVFHKEISSTCKISMGRILDGISPHMAEYPEEETFLVSGEREASMEDVVRILKETRTEIAANYLPVGSEKAARFYADCCIEAGVAFVNCMPVFIASDPVYAQRFMEKGLPVAGDDIKAQIGATITHRTLAKLFSDRGVTVDRTYQLNVGGNTDFLNMTAKDRLSSKKISKTEAVQSVLEDPLERKNIHIGPSDYVPWLRDNKLCFLRMEGRIFGNVPINLELRLSVEDSPNSAGCAVDAIRCCKIALERNIAGPLLAISAYTMKHPPRQIQDAAALEMLEEFISGKSKQPEFASESL